MCARVVTNAVCIILCPLGPEGLNQMNTDCEGKLKLSKKLHGFPASPLSFLLSFSPVFLIFQHVRQNTLRSIGPWNITDLPDLQSNFINETWKIWATPPQKKKNKQKQNKTCFAKATLQVSSRNYYKNRNTPLSLLRTRMFYSLDSWSMLIALQNKNEKILKYRNKLVIRKLIFHSLPGHWKIAVFA